MMDLSNLTIIVPTRNETRNIPAFLNSIPGHVALIVVDASDDETPDLIERLRPRQTTVIHQPAGIAEARQIGAEAARTPWLLFTDADITFAPDYFEILRSCRQSDALYGPKLSQSQFTRYYQWFAYGQQCSHWLGVPAATGSNMIVRRWVFKRVGGFDLGLSCNEDSELGWRIKRHGYRMRYRAQLVVHASDHRRLYWGKTRKTTHSVARCLLLYFNLMPAQWRSRDWGYWSNVPGTGNSSGKRTML